MKKLLACIISITLSLSFAACGKQQEEQSAEEASSAPAMRFYEGEVGKAEESKKDFTYDVDIEPNMSDDAELGFIRMTEPKDIDEWRETEYDENGEEIKPAPFVEKDININGVTEETLANTFAVSSCKLTSINLKSQGFLFSGRGYVWYKDPASLSSYGTVIYVENYGDISNAADKQTTSADDTVSTDDTASAADVYNKDKELVKGVCVSKEFLGHDFELSFYGDIKLGDKKTDIEKKLGTGTGMANKPKGTDVVYYKNSKNTLICVYLSDEEEAGIEWSSDEEVGCLIEVVVLNNDGTPSADSK